MEAAAKQLAEQSDKFHAFEWLRGLALQGHKHAQIILADGNGVLADMKREGREEVLYGPNAEMQGMIPVVLYFSNLPSAEDFVADLKKQNPALNVGRVG